jgi:O-antigen/teichoic acid export membrane protein
VAIPHGIVAKGSLWNLAGLVLALAAALVAVPLIVRGLGVERFGVLALTWAIIGAASMLDLGIGRALTQVVASRKASGDTADLATIVLTATAALGVLGVLGALALLAAAAPVAHYVFRVGPEVAAEAERAIRLLGISLPFVLCASALHGVLEGHLRFDLSNMVRVPLTLLNYLVPLAMLPFTADLGWIVGGTVLARGLALAAYGALVWNIMAREARVAMAPIAALRPVLALAGWMSVSTIVATAIVYLDRFVLAALDSMSAVAFYATPFELVTRLSLVAGAIGGALLPVFSSLGRSSAKQVGKVFARGLRYVTLLVFPATALVVLFAADGLALWLDGRFAAASTRIAQILAAGIFVNSLAVVPLTFLYAAGRADTVARLHLAELPFYALLLWQLVSRFGADGAALAWTLRVTVDAALLFVLARRIHPSGCPPLPRVAAIMGGGLAILALGIVLPAEDGRWVYAILFLSLFAMYLWFRMLDKEDRAAWGR